MNLREAAQQALDALEMGCTDHNGNPVDLVGPAITALRAALADTQDWDEIEVLRESLREHMAEIKRLNECLTWEQHRAEHVGTHGPGCAEWGPRHYECLLRAHRSLKERTDRSADTGKTSDHIPDAGKMVASVREDRTVEAIIKQSLTVEPVAYVTGYFDGKCVIKPIEPVVLPTGMALYRSPLNQSEDALGMVEPVAYCTLEQLAHLKLTVPSDDKIALYTAPPKRKPLTDEELFKLGAESHEDIAYDRAIKRAHGIGGEE